MDASEPGRVTICRIEHQGENTSASLQRPPIALHYGYVNLCGLRLADFIFWDCLQTPWLLAKPME
jgi:hypothetical protein